MRALRARLAMDRADAGLTLVELLTASFISVIMLGLVGTMFVTVTKLTANGQTTGAATATAWTVINELSGVIRQATQVSTGASTTEGGVIAGSTPTSIVVDSFANVTVTPGTAAIAPTRVTMTAVASGAVQEQRVVGTLSNGYYTFSGSGTTRTVGGPVVTSGTGTNALFVYYAGSTVVPPPAGGLTAAQASSITAVGLTVQVANPIAAGSGPVTLTNMITMPNIAIVNGGD